MQIMKCSHGLGNTTPKDFRANDIAGKFLVRLVHLL